MNDFVRFTDFDVRLKGIDTRLLYMEHYLRRRGIVTDLHFHAFWQLELIVRGAMTAWVSRDEYALKSGDILIIPPGLQHQFKYLDGSSEFFSVKFEIVAGEPHGSEPLFDEGSEMNALRRHLVESLSNEGLGREERVVAVKHALDALLELEYLKDDHSRKKDKSVAGLVKKCIDQRNGGKITVEEIARQLGYTRGHLTQLFHSKTGVSIKPYIDQERIKTAKHLIQFSDRTLSEIAYYLGFSDLFSFSKFFKRISGESPRGFKKRVHL
jgi:AraC-like DNA-binding protein